MKSRPCSIASALAAALFVGCATPLPPSSQFDFFLPPPTDHPWSDLVDGWQERTRESLASRSESPPEALGMRAAEQTGRLREKFEAFQVAQKRILAKRFAEWAQVEARRHYRSDHETSLADDHWPSLEELFERNGDDCDGLDLLAYHQLRDLGFRKDELYRALIRRERDGKFHMVTLWFETRDDPWVIDATGAITFTMRRMSELPGWAPTLVFSEDEQFSVVERTPFTKVMAAE